MKTQLASCRRLTRFSLLVTLGLAAPTLAQTPAPTNTDPDKPRIMESLPEKFRHRIAQLENEAAVGLFRKSVNRPFLVFTTTKRWQPGQTITVAFRGGDQALHRKIADTAKQWTNFANVVFDFGPDNSSGAFRTWRATDTSYAAQIRISFDQPGYYSNVGRDSANMAIVGPGEESMNLSGFDTNVPDNWAAVVLHEFGHALGFQHEHQHPEHACDFRWDDDPGYVKTKDAHGQYKKDGQGRRPGIYTVLSGHPNYWPADRVTFNLKQLEASSAFETTTFDKRSIMKYFFDAWMFANGSSSDCFTATENMKLSAQDKAGAAAFYPRDADAIERVNRELIQAVEVMKTIETLSPAARAHLRSM